MRQDRLDIPTDCCTMAAIFCGTGFLTSVLSVVGRAFHELREPWGAQPQGTTDGGDGRGPDGPPQDFLELLETIGLPSHACLLDRPGIQPR